MEKALVYQKLPGQKVRCLVCQRKCLIAPDETGFCQTKLNQKGELYTLNYGLLNGPIQVDPIEKKPFYHFRPGTLVPSLGSWGCNFHCKQCLNWWCSWGEPAGSTLTNAAVYPERIREVSPASLITQITSAGYRGIAFTYNEPVVWAEFVLATAKLAKKKGLFTLFVTNGSWSRETLDKIGPFIDAANIDLKGFSEKTYARQGAFFGRIPQMALYAQKKHRIFLELTTLLIPGVNNDPGEIKKMTDWIVKNLGPKTPWHLSRFDPRLAPDPEFQKIPATSVKQLEEAVRIGRKSGLQFIYLWAPGSEFPNGVYTRNDTLCPKCGTAAIKREGWEPDLSGVDEKGKCRSCREDLNLKPRLSG